MALGSNKTSLETKLVRNGISILEGPTSNDYQVVTAVRPTQAEAEEAFLGYLGERKISSIFGLKSETVKDKYKVSAAGYVKGSSHYSK